MDQKQNFTSIKGCNSVANFAKNDCLQSQHRELVNDNVYAKLGPNPSICSQDMEQKPNFDINLIKGCNSVAN